MPSAHTLQYAIPLCYASRMERHGQHGWHFTCYRPLRYQALENVWRCLDCGASINGAIVASRGLPAAEDLAA